MSVGAAQLAQAYEKLTSLVTRGRKAQRALQETGEFLDEIEETAKRNVCAAVDKSERKLRAATSDLRAICTLRENLTAAVNRAASAQAQLERLRATEPSQQQGGMNGGEPGPVGPASDGQPG